MGQGEVLSNIQDLEASRGREGAVLSNIPDLEA